MGFTQDLRNKVMDHVFRGEALTPPSSVYVGLFNGSSEIIGGGYSRVEVIFGTPVNGIVENANALQFPIATSDWGNITSASIYDSMTGGNRLADAQAIAPQEVGTNQQFIIPIGNLTVELRGE